MSRHPLLSSTSSTPPLDHTALTVTDVSTDESSPIVHVSEYTVPMYGGCVSMAIFTVGCGTGERICRDRILVLYCIIHSFIHNYNYVDTT